MPVPERAAYDKSVAGLFTVLSRAQPLAPFLEVFLEIGDRGVRFRLRRKQRGAVEAGRDRDARHPGGARRDDAERRVLEGQALRRVAFEQPGGGQEDVGKRLAATDLAAASDPGDAVAKPQLAQRVRHVLRRRRGRDRDAHAARLEQIQEAHQAAASARGVRATARGTATSFSSAKRACSSSESSRPNRSGKISRLRLPSKRARWAMSRGGRPCRSAKIAKAATWKDMLSTIVPSRSKTTPRKLNRVSPDRLKTGRSGMLAGLAAVEDALEEQARRAAPSTPRPASWVCAGSP